MGEQDITSRLELAAEAIREAGMLALRAFRRREMLAVRQKGPQDWVSEADRQVERLVRERLLERFPEDRFLGEEGGGELGPRGWLLDPIDGTANFLRGIPYWSIALAFLADGRVELALTYDPVHDELFTARLGHGARAGARALRVSERAEPELAVIALGHRFGDGGADYAALVKALLRRGFEHRRLGSVALSLAHVADGRLEGLIAPAMRAWDVVPGLLLVREAGGWCRDFPLSQYTSAPVAAANPALAPLVAEILEESSQGRTSEPEPAARPPHRGRQ